MKRNYIIFLVVLASAGVLIAQSQDQHSRPLGASNDATPPPSANWQMETPASHGVFCIAGPDQRGCPVLTPCPVLMEAKHLSDGSLVKTDNAHPKGMGQWLSLSLTTPNQKQIESAILAIRGITPKGHVAEALAAGRGSPDAVWSFHISFVAGPHGASVADLWVPRMSAVERIDLLAVEWSDGSKWKVADGQICHVAPDPFMLVTNR